MKHNKEKLLQLFREHCQRFQHFKKKSHLLLAVSGGVDSCVMLDLMARLQHEFDLKLTIGHVHHQLRGSSADSDAEFTAALAEKYELPFLLKKVNVKEYASAKQLSIETAARHLRYQAFAEMCAQINAETIATAHQSNDQAETVLAHLIRGSGLKGLAGIPPVRKTVNSSTLIIRPLLPFSRSQILEYAQQRQLVWREDESNKDVTFFRNRIRHELLPLLENRFNQNICNNLKNFASIASHTESYLQHETKKALESIIKERTDHKIVLDIQGFWNYFHIIQMYVVRTVMQQISGFDCHLTFKETDRILSLAKSAHHQQDAPTGRRYIWRNLVEVSADLTDIAFSLLQPLPPVRNLEVGKRCLIPEAGLAISADKVFKLSNWRSRSAAHSQFIDAEKIHSRLKIRFPQHGDRFKPLGMQGFKKLSDFFIDAKVPRHKRALIPLVVCGDEIVWVCGYRLDDRFKLTEKTRTALHLQSAALTSLQEG